MPGMSGSRPPVAARYLSPAVGPHQLGPAAVELAMITFAHAEIAGPGIEVRIEAFVPQTHLRVHGHAPRDHTAAGAGALLPVVHIVLLESAGGAEAPHTGQSHRFLDVRRRRFVDVDPRPHLGLVRTARVPDAECAGGGAEHRKIREGRADDRVDPTRAGPETLLDLRADLPLIFQNLGDRRVGHVIRPKADQYVAVAGGYQTPLGLRLGRCARAKVCAD